MKNKRKYKKNNKSFTVRCKGPLGRNTVDATDTPCVTKELLESSAPKFKNEDSDYEVIDTECEYKNEYNEWLSRNDTLTISENTHVHFIESGNTYFPTVPANNYYDDDMIRVGVGETMGIDEKE